MSDVADSSMLLIDHHFDCTIADVGQAMRVPAKAAITATVSFVIESRAPHFLVER